MHIKLNNCDEVFYIAIYVNKTCLAEVGSTRSWNFQHCFKGYQSYNNNGNNSPIPRHIGRLPSSAEHSKHQSWIQATIFPRHIDGIADGSWAPTLAIKIATLISAFATASCPDEQLDPMASSSAWYDFKQRLKTCLEHTWLIWRHL